MKDISNSICKDKRPIINPNHTNNINYNSKSFLNGLNKVKEEIRKDNEMAVPDHERKYLSYNI